MSAWEGLPLCEQYEARAAETSAMIEAWEGRAEPERIAKWTRGMKADLRKAAKLRAREVAA